MSALFARVVARYTAKIGSVTTRSHYNYSSTLGARSLPALQRWTSHYREAHYSNMATPKPSKTHVDVAEYYGKVRSRTRVPIYCQGTWGCLSRFARTRM